MENHEIKEQPREFKEERFEFALYINNNLICKRNFKINNYIDDSMQSVEFKGTVDDIVEMVNSDLKSKSRVYTWYYYNENETDTEFTNPLIEPWECTFKFVITDNKKEVISKIWDGYAYPKSIREKVDITNKYVRFTTKDGRTYSIDKEKYFEENKNRLNEEMYIMKSMISDKQDLLLAITKKICEVCSPREDGFQMVGDYTFFSQYKNKSYEKTIDGTLKRDVNGKLIGKNSKPKKYCTSIKLSNKRYFAEWAKAVEGKTKNYFKNLF